MGLKAGTKVKLIRFALRVETEEKFVKFPEELLMDTEVSMGAKALYAFYVTETIKSCGIRGAKPKVIQGSMVEEMYKYFKISSAKYYRLKRELEMAGYVCIVNMNHPYYPRKKIKGLFLGNKQHPAKDAAEKFIKENDLGGRNLLLKEMFCSVNQPFQGKV